MAAEKGGSIPNSTKIDDLIQALKSTDAIVNVIVNSAMKIKEISDPKKFASSKQVAKNVAGFVKNVSDIIRILQDGFNDKDISMFIDRVEELDFKEGKNGQIIETKKAGDVKVVVAIKAVSDIVGAVTNMMSSLSKNDASVKAFINMKANLFMIKQGLHEVVDMIKKEFGSMDDKTKEMLSSLVTDPGTLQKLEKKTFDKDTGKQTSSEETLVGEKGKIGILDGIVKFFEIINMLNDIKAPNFVTLKINMFLTSVALKEVIADIDKLVTENNLNKMVEKGGSLDVFSEFVSKLSGEDGGDSVFEQLEEISKSLAIIGVLSPLAYIGAWLGAKVLNVFVKGLVNFNEIMNKVNVSDEAVEKLDQLKEISLNLMVLVGTWALMGLLIITTFPLVLLGWVGFEIMTLLCIVALKTLSLIGKDTDMSTIKQNIIDLSVITLAIMGITVMWTLMGKLVISSFINIAVGFLATVVIIIAFAGILWLLRSKMFDGKNIDEALLNILKISVVVIALSLVIALLALVGVLIIETGAAILTGLGVMVLVLLIFGGLLFFLSLIKQQIIEGTLALVSIAIAVMLVSVAVLTLAVAALLWEKVSWEGFGKVMAVLGGFIAITVIAGALISFIAPGIAALVSLGVGMMAISASLLILAIAAMLWTNVDEEGVSKMNKALLKMIGLAILCGVSAILIIPGAAAMILLSAAMIVLSIATMLLIGTYHLLPDDDKWMDKLSDAIKAFIGVAVKVGVQSLLLIAAIPGMAILLTVSLMTLVIVTNLFIISKEMDSIDKDKLSKDNIDSIIINPLNDIIDGINSINYIDAIKAANRFKAIGTTMVRPILGMIKIMKELSDMRIAEYDKNGKIVGYREYTPADYENARKSVVQIALALVDICNNEEIQNISVNGAKKTKKVFKKLAGIISPLSGMIDIIKELADGNVEVEENGKTVKKNLIKYINDHTTDIQNSILNVVTAFTSAVAGITIGKEEEEKIKSTKKVFEKLLPIVECVKNITDVTKDLPKETNTGSISTIITDTITAANNIGDKKVVDIKTQTKAVNNFVKFVGKANSINVEKIQTVTSMFGQMTEFSKSLNGNIEDLAKVLSEDLVEALNKLNGALEGTGETAEKATAVGTSEKQDSKTTAATTSTDNKGTQASQKVDLSGVESKLQDIVRKLTSINSNIQEIG